MQEQAKLFDQDHGKEKIPFKCGVDKAPLTRKRKDQWLKPPPGYAYAASQEKKRALIQTSIQKEILNTTVANIKTLFFNLIVKTYSKL